MSNIDYLEFFDSEMHSAYIAKLFWIAGSFESSEMSEYIRDLEEDSWAEMIPDLHKSDYFQEYFTRKEMIEFLVENGLRGFIAEINHPLHCDFTFDEDGSFKSCSVKSYHCWVSYVYAETIEELTEKIKLNAEKLYNQMIAYESTPRPHPLTTK